MKISSNGGAVPFLKRMKQFIVPYLTNLKDFTDSTYIQGSFAYAQLLRQKDIKVNGVKVSTNVPLQAGDVVTYYTTPKQESKLGYTVLFEDTNVLVVDKSSGVASEAIAVATGAALVHRLDRNTAGVMALAKTDGAELAFKQAFRDGDMQKTYLCLCKNKFRKNSELLTAFLIKDEKNSLVTVVDEPVSGSVKIVTEYTVWKKQGLYALVKVTLHTGKTHQIRAHMAHIGCPVLGDEKYGDEALNQKFSVKRQCLVAKSLVFKTKGVLAYLNGYTFESAAFPELPKKS